MKSRFSLAVATGISVTAAATLHAQLFSQWNFNSGNDATTSTGTLTPSFGSGTAALIGGTTSTFASGGTSTDPNTTDDSAWNISTWAAQGTENKSRGVQFTVSTVGMTDISVSWDQRHSNSSSEYVVFQYSTDGTTFTDFATFQGQTGDTWFNGRSADLSSIAAVENNPSFAFRIVQSFGSDNLNYEPSNQAAAYATTGTWRFDMVTVNATPVPEPEEYAAMAAGGLLAFAVWRRRQSR
jgi:hypothetical protein